jgi:type II secretory pathway pseudopilin PulG
MNQEARMSGSTRGASLIEILVGIVVASVLVAGLMGAFLTAMRISARGGGNTEAAALTQQTLERLRNKVACGSSWFGGANCGATLPSPNSFDPGAGNDPATGLPPGALNGTGVSRTYTVTSDDCDGVGGAGDCFKVAAKVHWMPPQ